METQNVSINQGHCLHCNESLKPSLITYNNDQAFCCDGCKVVYRCLQSGGLDQYYQLLKDEGKLPRKSPEKSQLLYLDDEGFQKEFTQSKSSHHYLFFAQGIECVACTWVFGQLNELYGDLEVCGFDLTNNVLELKSDDLEQIKNVTSFILKMGYGLVPLKKIENANEKLLLEKRSQLIKIGVAAAVLMNLMIYSIALYADAQGQLQEIFRHFSAALFLPIPFYCALPFYKSVYFQLRSFKFSLDFPISLSILLGSFISYQNYFLGSDVFYFDSICMFVFLILSVRFFLIYRLQRECLSNVKLAGPVQEVEQVLGDQIFAKHISQIEKGSELLIRKGDLFPLDGQVVSGQTYANESLITGESQSCLKKAGSRIYAGAKNLSHDISVRVTTTEKTNSYNQFLESAKLDTSLLHDYAGFGQKYARYLTSAILLVSLLVLFTEGTSEQAMGKILALLIICCPCALGIGIPLATLLKIKNLKKFGIQVNNNDVFEKIKKARILCFDKTGTLTSGKFEVLELNDQAVKHLPSLVALEKSSDHPLGKYLYKRFIDYDFDLQVEEFQEIPGVGPCGTIDGEFYEVKRRGEEVVCLRNNQVIVALKLKEEYVTENIELLGALREKFSLKILSGDSAQNVDDFLKKLPSAHNIESHSNLTPDDKKSLIEKFEEAIYVGDGLNDVFAMQAAQSSISLNANELVNQACDVVFLGGDLKKLSFFFFQVKKLHRLVKANIILSSTYNIIGVFLVINNMVSPLVAAVVMPLSSILVVGQTYLRSKVRMQS